MRTCGLVLFSCAGLLLSGGTILGGTVAWALIRLSYYFWNSDLGVELGSAILFVGASLLCLPTCWLSTLVPYHTKSVHMNLTLMGVVSVTMLMMSMGMTSMSALSRAVREPTVLNSSMYRTMAADAYDPAVRSSFAAMQLKLRCCGVQSYNDWFQYRHTLPYACCGRAWNGKRGDICQVPVFTRGCLRPALIELRNFVNTVAALSSALIMVMAVTLFASAYILVVNEVDRTNIRTYKTPPGPLRIGIACLAQPLPAPGASPRVTLFEPDMQPPMNIIP